MTRRKPNHMTDAEGKPCAFTLLGLLRLKPPEAGQIEYWDAGSKGQLGLRVLVSSGGTKTYRSTFYLHGKAHARAIGRVGELELVVARERVRTDRKLAAEGIDPRRQFKDERMANQVSYEHVVDQYVEHCKPTQWTWDLTQRVLKNCTPLLKRPIRAITDIEVEEMLRSFVAEGHPAKADMARSLLTTLFKWAVKKKYLTSSIMEGVDIDIEKGSRERVYKADEIKAIWQAANKLDANTGGYVKLLLLLAPRKTALALLSRRQLDSLDNPTLWTTPAAAVKVRKKSAYKKRVYLTPLPQLAQRIVKALLKDHDDERVFPQLSVYTTKAGRQNFDGKELAAQLIELGAPNDFAYHTMRHTVATFLEDNGVDEWSRGLILNHGSSSVTGDYSHGFARKHKLELLELWASHVEQLVQPQGVTLLR
jgi:integrase